MSRILKKSENGGATKESLLNILNKYTFLLILIMNVLIILFQLCYDYFNVINKCNPFNMYPYSISIAVLAFSQIFPFIFITNLITAHVRVGVEKGKIEMDIETDVFDNLYQNLSLAGFFSLITALLLCFTIVSKEWAFVFSLISIILSLFYFFKVFNGRGERSNLLTRTNNPLY